MNRQHSALHRLTILFTAAIIAIFCGTDIASAHSTKGRIRTDLTIARPTADDFAYFMESYVHNELYRHREEKWEKRFYVREFKEVKFQENGKTAEVFFIRLDTKGNKLLDQSMVFERGRDKVWFFTDDMGVKVPVYTYLPKARYYYEKYVLPVSGGATALFLVVLGLLIWRRKRKMPQNMEEEADKGQRDQTGKLPVDTADKDQQE